MVEPSGPSQCSLGELSDKLAFRRPRARPAGEAEAQGQSSGINLDGETTSGAGLSASAANAKMNSRVTLSPANREARVHRRRARLTRLTAMDLEANLSANTQQDQTNTENQNAANQQVSRPAKSRSSSGGASSSGCSNSSIADKPDRIAAGGELARLACSSCCTCCSFHHQRKQFTSRSVSCACNSCSPSSLASPSSSSFGAACSVPPTPPHTTSDLPPPERTSKSKSLNNRSEPKLDLDLDQLQEANESSESSAHDTAEELSEATKASIDSWQQVAGAQVDDLRLINKGKSQPRVDQLSSRRRLTSPTLLSSAGAGVITSLAPSTQVRGYNRRRRKRRELHIAQAQGWLERKMPIHVAGKKKKSRPEEEGDLKHHMDWKDIAHKYGKMPAESSRSGKLGKRLCQSQCCCLVLAAINSLFPIFSSFKGYSLSRDLIGDLLAGFTISVLHIPQGMAYGLLAGVEPIYGLYVSFVPVLVMTLMSRSRHVSYGTFAILSMVLVNASQSVKLAITEYNTNQVHASRSSNRIAIDLEPALLITDNHQPVDHLQHNLLRNLIESRPFNAPSESPDEPNNSTSANLDSILSGNSQLVMPSNIEILTGIAAAAGIIQILMSLVNMGALTLMFSDQLVSSFTTGSAVHVITSQLAGLFDLVLPNIPSGPFEVFRTWQAFYVRLSEGCNLATAVLSLSSILFLFTFKEFIEPRIKRDNPALPCFPTELILMGVLVLCSWFWKFNSDYGIRIVGHIPTGLPQFELPKPQLALYVVGDTFTIALVSFAVNLSLAQMYAKRYKYKVEPNHELLSIGAANIVGSLFSCFPCGSSLSRSAVMSNLNPKSQLSSLLSCAVVVGIICYMAPLLYDLPRSTLSCIIVVALKGILVQVRDLKENWRLSKLDAFVWLFTFSAVILVGVTYGLILGIVASISTIFFR